MIISVVHLSDIHLKTDDNHIFDKLDRLASSINSNTKSSNQVIILTTGDVAFSGGEKEYALAENLYANLFDALEVEQKKIMFAPGNHDCNHEDETTMKVREQLIETIVADRSKIEIFEQPILNAQAHYNIFNAKVSVADTENIFCNKYKVMCSNGLDIDIFTLNSAWMSEKKEVPGKIIPYKYTAINNSEARIKICAMHHTPNWFNPDDRRDFRKNIEAETNFLLTGHEHDFYAANVKNHEGQEVVYIEGQVLQDSSNSENSGYNILNINIDNLEYNITTHKFKESIYKQTTITDEWTPINATKSKTTVTPNSGYLEHIKDPGMLYMHPRKKNLNLQDIYVFPDLRDLDKEKKSHKNLCIPPTNSEKVLSSSPIKTIILGEEKSGRSSFCKQIYLFHQNNGNIPILLSGNDIKKHSLDSFQKALLNAFSQQYSTDQKDLFEQTDKEKIFIIIDDFNKSKLNYKYKCMLLNSLAATYDNILLTADELFQIQEFVTEDISDIGRKYHLYQIEPFGHLLRSKLITKWNELGQETYLSQEELTRLHDKAKRTIDTVIGKNYVPSFPFFLITILNSMNDTGKQGIVESSYGYYYDYLITGTLKNLKLNNDDIDALYNYLTELSYKLFFDNTSSLTSTEINDFHTLYCDEYSLNLDKNSLLKTLTDSNILRNFNDEFSFRYTYYYYYFLARYISQHIQQECAQKIITEMCSTLHLDESSNVIMFLTHLCKSPYVLEQVLQNSKKIFDTNKPTTLQKDVEIINKLVNRLPQIELEDCSVDQYREKDLKLKDQIEQKSIHEHVDLTQDKDKDAYELIVSIQKAFKHQEIIGQILKNYYGSLKGNVKQELCSEAFNLCLRSLSEFYNLLNSNLALIVEEIKEIIIEEDKTKEDKIEDRAKRELFHICEQISYCFLKKISSSIGSDKLEETYKKIVKENPTVANEVIDIAIKLDFFQAFPIKDVKNLCKKLENNILPYSILKRLVVNYLYMFPTTVQLKQQICAATNISMNCQRAIEATTHTKKSP
ncbi:metallophosphoesterase [Maridesulfovibrio ferrireducens]|uniref:STAND family AAA ATPase n=1 Tax=Maridesulfovibrio ferrireducens TaxID=246191 RepID=UPI001A317CAE|nr:metallophosphoesterase [Maridesulfovibrio ferrireducens]MBI9109567.1 metallophosphoesterase [Maridesulfovibrio ferrireducens]